MCGLLALIDFKNKLNYSIDNLNSYRDAMTSRGPDDKGHWIDEDYKIYLGHRRLSILDTSKNGVQPMFDQSKKFAILYNGEVYNFKNLKLKLLSFGYKFKSVSDTEVILNMYIHYGEKFVTYLEGMFSIVIYDFIKDEVLAYRDKFGIKPLYVYKKDSFIGLCSQVKPLLNIKNLDLSYSDQGHISFLMWGSVSEPHTLYEKIKTVETGTYLKINRDGLISLKYFDINNLDQLPKKNNFLKNILLDTVSRHTVSDVPICTFLSSGIDSTTILENLNIVENVSLNTINLSFEYKNNFLDETYDSEMIASLYNSNHYKKKISNNDFFLDENNIFQHMDQPTVDGINTYFISKFAREKNFKVALSGLGADEIFKGYDLFKQIPKIYKLFKLFPKEIGKIISKFGHKVNNDKIMKLLILMKDKESIPWLYYVKRGIFMPHEINKFFNIKTIKDHIDNYILKTERLCDSNILSSLSKIEFENYLKNQLLRDSDWAGMASSIEIRVPFVDANFISNLSNTNIFEHNYQKKDLTNLIKQPNIKKIISKPKRGFYTPVEHWVDKNSISDSNEYKLTKSWSLNVLNKFSNYIN